MSSHPSLIYLDAAATTPVRREALEAMWPYLTSQFGNPSAANVLGHEAARGLAQARHQMAEAFGTRAGEVVFTSGGTESNHLGIIGLALANPRGKHLITSAIEHSSVLAACRFLEEHCGFEVTVLPVTEEGFVELDALSAELLPDTTLVSIHHANNEIGVVQDVAGLAAVTRGVGALFHVDAVQSASALPVSLRELDVDAISISGHKLGGPKGIGALLVRFGVPIKPLLGGGSQESDRRSGTENVAGAVGLASAATTRRHPAAKTTPRHRAAASTPRHPAAEGSQDPLRNCRNDLIESVLAEVPGAQLTGPTEARHPGHASFVFEGIVGDTLVAALEERGVIASGGAACGAQRAEASHVLLALGLSEALAHSALRLTFSEPFDVTAVTDAIADAVTSLRGLG